MPTGWWPRKIHCSNCNFEGRAKVKGAGCLAWIVLLATFLISFLYWPLFIITGLLFFYLLLKPSTLICQKCEWEFPIPLSSSEKSPDRIGDRFYSVVDIYRNKM
jgi:hypothetical protein